MRSAMLLQSLRTLRALLIAGTTPWIAGGLPLQASADDPGRRVAVTAVYEHDLAGVMVRLKVSDDMASENGALIFDIGARPVSQAQWLEAGGRLADVDPQCPQCAVRSDDAVQVLHFLMEMKRMTRRPYRLPLPEELTAACHAPKETFMEDMNDAGAEGTWIAAPDGALDVMRCDGSRAAVLAGSPGPQLRLAIAFQSGTRNLAKDRANNGLMRRTDHLHAASDMAYSRME
jgi:hypothetical protein